MNEARYRVDFEQRFGKPTPWAPKSSIVTVYSGDDLVAAQEAFRLALTRADTGGYLVLMDTYSIGQIAEATIPPRAR